MPESREPQLVDSPNVLAEPANPGSSIGIATLDSKGTVLAANEAFIRLLRLENPADRLSLGAQIASCFKASTLEFQTKLEQPAGAVVQLQGAGEYPVVRLRLDNLHDGQRIVIAETALDGDDDPEENYKQTHLDPLTQLGNRRLLTDVIDGWKPQGTDCQRIAAVMMDLDRFKYVNDSLGHEAGDALLKLVAERVKRAARADDTVIRLGGDEFIVLQSIPVDGNEPEQVAKKLVELMGRPFLVSGQQVNIGTSVGIAVLNQGTENIQELIKHADLALYHAKAAGRGTYEFFDPELEKAAVERREIELRLRRALSLREFRLVYQPQVDLQAGKLTGFEALIRWHTIDGDIVEPDDFIPMAEDIGEIFKIGEWVLRTACMEAANWPEELVVAVNISPLQFENSHFVESIHTALMISGLPAHRLELEITESVLINNIDNALNHLWAIQSMGVGIAMDDFGTGYSSLSYLNSFPFSKIKIDRSFVKGKPTLKSRALVEAIIALGSSLGMWTLAEGVETEAQYTQLSESGCKQAQGFLFSKPLSEADVEPFISDFSIQELKRGNNND